MHGEYKMPGGKLIVADVEIADGGLAAVQISGDFFLEPDTALDTINRALTGLAVDVDERTMSDAIDATLGADVAMYGISSQAIATAVARALGAKT
ncbi:MAG TPA: biotin--protein ligase [Oleiagrimonas sp.]|nr:biotin--protein ligase [Oleiagrimonas sp.]